MNSPLTTYLTLVVGSGVLNLMLGCHVVVKRQLYGPIATFFVLATASTTIYCFAYAFSLTSTTLAQLRFWSVVQYLGIPFAPAFGLLFVLHYLDFKLTKWRIAALLVIPTISLLSNATNELHHLHYKSYQIHETLGAPYNDIEVGPTYILHGAHTMVCLLGSILLLLSRWKNSGKTYRLHLVSLIGAHLVPMTASFLYLIGVTPEGIDPVPMVVGLTAIFMWWTMESYRLLTVVPIAKDAIFHSISDGVIVLDKPGRLIEFNNGSQKMFANLNQTMYGQPLAEVWPVLFGKNAPPPPNLSADSQELEVVVHEPQERFYQVRISPLLPSASSSRAGTVILISDITEIKQLQRTLEYRAYYDELTKVLNRRAFFERCEERFAWARQNALPFTVILFDIDHFKKINDTWGHDAGDQALIHVARICQSLLSEDMLFSRYGGEEFVLALFGLTAEEGRMLAEQLRRQIESRPLIVNETVIKITSSFGVAQSTLREEESLQHLLNLADQALYEAKRGGRNQVCLYSGQPA